MSGIYNKNHQEVSINTLQQQPKEQLPSPPSSMKTTQPAKPNSNKPRKFRNKFVPSFQVPKKSKNLSKDKQIKKVTNSLDKTSSTSQSSKKKQTTAVVSSVTKKQKFSSSQYLDHLVQFELAEKQRLEDIKKEVLEITSRPTINHLAVKAHGGTPYLNFHDFHSQYATRILAVGDPINIKLWDTYIPQLAFGSSMVSNALVAYDALYLARAKQVPDRNLEAIASEHFFAGTQELMKATNNIDSVNLFELYAASYLVAAFAIAIPDQVPIISPDQSKPELFRIIRGVFNPYYKVLVNRYCTSPFFLPAAIDIPQTLDELDPTILTHPKVELFKLLWDQVDSMEAGSTSIEILSNPEFSPLNSTASTEPSVPAVPTMNDDNDLGSYDFPQQDFFNNASLSEPNSFVVWDENQEINDGSNGSGGDVTKADIHPQNSHTEQTVTESLLSEIFSSPNAENSDFSSPEESLKSPPETDSTTVFNASENAITSKQTLMIMNRRLSLRTTNKLPPPLDETDPSLFQLLPNEARCYRKAIYDMIHVVYGSTVFKSSTILVVAFNAVNDEFMGFLRARRPMALVIIAYMMSLFWFKDRFILNESTYMRRMQEVKAMAPESWKPAFYWPQQILEKHQLHNSLERMMEEIELSK